MCVISGGGFDQLREQVVEPLVPGGDELARLHLMPVNGTRYRRWHEGEWHEGYAEEVPVGDVEKSRRVFVDRVRRLGLWDPDHHGDVIQDRCSQVTYSTLGVDAPLEARLAWDPDGSKKERLRDYAAQRLPDLEVRSGGATAVDFATTAALMPDVSAA